MEFEEVATHFGYSLGVGAIPVKKFAYHRQAPRRPQEAQGDRAARDRSLQHLVAQLSEAGREDRRQARRAHPQLPDAALAQAGALQHRKRRPLRAGRRHLHALHFAHPPLSRPDRPPPAARRLDRQADAWRGPSCSRSPTSARNPSAAPPTPSANWSSGRKSSS